MKTFKSNRKNTGAAGVASKACAWILSIMLVVTGLAPSFAANDKAGKGNASVATKVASKAKVPSKTEVTTKDKATSKTKTTNKPNADKKDVSSSSKKQKTLKDKEEKNGKENKIKNKRGQIFNLNSSGNVYVEFDGNDNLTVLAKNTSSDMNIEKDKWWDMAKKFGVKYDSYGWKDSNVKNIKFNTNGIYLPKESAYFFKEIKGEIKGCEKLNTSKVERMYSMFEGATSANPDVSKWDTSNVTDIGDMFEGATSANPDVSKWDTSKVDDMRRTFEQAT